MVVQIIEFIIAVACISGIAIYGITIYSRIARRKNQYNIDEMISRINYKEQDIVGHLDYIIDAAIDEYMILNIVPKEIYYINNKLQTEMYNYLIEQIPSRISKTLITQLGIIYDDNYIGKFIGNEIYFTVTTRVVEFNNNGGYEIPGNVSGNKKE